MFLFPQRNTIQDSYGSRTIGGDKHCTAIASGCTKRKNEKSTQIYQDLTITNPNATSNELWLDL